MEWLFRIRELVIDCFFAGLVIILFAVLGYVFWMAYQGTHPQPKTHWNQGPQDPIPTE
jgi:hypothetical protein